MSEIHSESNQEEIAEKLADEIIENTDVKLDKTQRLINAIANLFGSLENFYKEFYQDLSSIELENFGKLVDAEVERKKSQRLNLASIINGKIFEKIIGNFKKAQTGTMSDADHAAPIRPSSVDTAWDEDKGRER